MAEYASDTVFLIDDDPGTVSALSLLLTAAGFHVEPYTSAAEFLHRYRLEVPGCAIIDIAIGDWSGLDLQRQLGDDNYDRPVIFISGRSDLATGVQAMKAGAVDFLTKPVRFDDLFRATKLALARDQKARRELAERSAVRQRLCTLTRREYEVLMRILEGKPNKVIAYELGIVEKTAKVHRGRIMSKMVARNLVELIRMAEHAPTAGPNSLA